MSDVKVGDYVAVKAFKDVPAFTGPVTRVIGEPGETLIYHVRNDIERKTFCRTRGEFTVLT